MFKFCRVMILVTLGVAWSSLSLTAQAETLRFAWPDGASAKVQTRSEGRRVIKSREITWDMSTDFTVHIQRNGDRVVMSRHNFSGWKGTFPPSFGGGAERFVDMIPTFIVSNDGTFIEIEGHEAARKLMNSSVEQSGGLNAVSRNAFESFLTNAALRAMSTDHWSTLVPLWLEVELDPEASYELRNVVKVPQLGGGEVEITGLVNFVKETPCAAGQAERRCVHMHAETGPDKAQVTKLIQSFTRQVGVNMPADVIWDQRFKVDIVLDKATMLPQQLTIIRLNTFNHKRQGQDEGGSEEIKKNYTFTWLLPDDKRKK